LPYEKLNEIKAVERVVELFYNSRKFTFTLEYIVKSYGSPWEFYERLAGFWQTNGYASKPHGKLLLYEVMRAFGEREKLNAICLLDLLRFDLLINENEKNVPEWLTPALNDKQKRQSREVKRNGNESSRLTSRQRDGDNAQIANTNHIRLEYFNTDILAYLRGETLTPHEQSGSVALLISYPKPGRQSPLRPLERVDYFV
jgi:hypothetical protein